MRAHRDFLAAELYSFCGEVMMARFSWTHTASLALASLVYGQSSSSDPADGLTTAAGSATASVGTATVDGTPTTYSVAFTVPADADVGPSLLPNIYDSQAVQAQAVCPGYKASNVQKTENGITASLSLAGDPVRSLKLQVERTKHVLTRY